jgi:hypothetical protein
LKYKKEPLQGFSYQLATRLPKADQGQYFAAKGFFITPAPALDDKAHAASIIPISILIILPVIKFLLINSFQSQYIYGV